MLSPVRLSSVCLSVCLSVWYIGHPLTSTKKITEIVLGEPLRWGELNARGVAKYSDFGPIDGYISETVQDRSTYATSY